MRSLSTALKILKEKKFYEARIILEELLRGDPKDVEVMYNLGMCYTELGEIPKAIETLNRCIQLAPKHSNAHVALSFAHIKENDLPKAKEYLLRALDISPDNPYALKNLGGLLGKSGNNLMALYYLKKSFATNPYDAYTAYGLGVTYQGLGDLESADRYFKKTLDMNSPPDLQNLARDRLREIAVINLKSKGFRADAAIYCLKSLHYFDNKSIKEVQRVSFEIALKGRSGLDINDPSQKYQLDSLQGKFSGLELVCYMYVGFKLFASEMDVGIDLSEEYKAALRQFNEKDEKWDCN
jgi:tetratricopeptide (TPR) repeat protein